MIRTILIKNEFNIVQYYESAIISVTDFITDELINIEITSDSIQRLRGINSDLITVTVQYSNTNETFHNISLASINERNDVKNKFPEYFI